MSRTIRHSADELKPYASVADQFGFRRDLVLEALREEGVEFASLSAVIGRGGLVKPIESGVYEVTTRCGATWAMLRRASMPRIWAG